MSGQKTSPRGSGSHSPTSARAPPTPQREGYDSAPCAWMRETSATVIIAAQLAARAIDSLRRALIRWPRVSCVASLVIVRAAGKTEGDKALLTKQIAAAHCR